MRYSRQSILKEIGKSGQEKIRKTTICVIGVGGLGSNAAELLFRAGIGCLILIDNDKVDITNLQRQSLYTEKDIGKKKAEAAKQRLKEINSEVEIIVHTVELTSKNADLMHSDLILDCTDNLNTRYLINNYCTKHKIPWVHGSAIKSVGQVKVFQPGKECYECIYPEHKVVETCAEVGIFNTIVRVIASIQVMEALKIILGKKSEQDLLRTDLWKNEIFKIKVKKNKKCRNCKGEYNFIK